MQRTFNAFNDMHRSEKEKKTATIHFLNTMDIRLWIKG